MTGSGAMKVDLNVSRVKNKRKSSSQLAKEQEVPLIKTTILLDESSSMSSIPSSPSMSSSIMEDIIQPSSSAGVPTDTVKSGRKPDKKLQNGTGHEAPVQISLHASLIQKARIAMSALLPLFDKMPQEVVFGDDVLETTKSPAFTAFCESEQLKAPMYMQPSSVLNQLERFTRGDAAGPNKFKRPHSPQSAGGTGQQQGKKAKNVKTAPTAFSTVGASVGDLKSRLQAKLQAFREKRKANLDLDETSAFHDVRRKLNKLKKKEKSRNKKQQLKQSTKGSPIAGDAGGGSSTPSSARSSSVVSEEGKMIFSRFDFFDTDKQPHPKQLAGKNLTHLINKAEAEKRKMDHLQSTDEGKATAVREKKAWSEALLKAQGVKLKNDPAKLKHALKEQTKRKDKSAKKWEERKQNINQEQKQRQDKRQTNIQARQTAKKNKKRKRSIKKGHIIPGFN